MTDLAVFTYSNLDVRTVVRDGEPWFVAVDVCAVLGVANPTDAVRSLDDDEYELVPAALVSSEGRPQDLLNVVTESGLYSLILRSRKPEAKAFKRWITHEVLPALRKTGRYETAPAIPQTYAAALQLAADQARQIEAQSEELAVAVPKADAWDHLASAAGDYAVADAAKILSRHPLIKLGRDRLFTLLARDGWCYRRQIDNRWTVYQRAVDSGWVTELASSHYHPRTGELVLDAPQVRITAKGLGELVKRFGAGEQTTIEAAA
jgi:prophage antirepressor-like protein